MLSGVVWHGMILDGISTGNRLRHNAYKKELEDIFPKLFGYIRKD